MSHSPRDGSGVFVIGTDTGVGKTVISESLLLLARQRYGQVAGMKPIAAGSTPTPDGLRNADAEALWKRSRAGLPYAWINPYALTAPIAPHLAARQDGVRVDPERILEALRLLQTRTRYVVVEGVGGWRVPISDELELRDLARLIDLPILLVVGIRLGCLNHTLLTVDSVLSAGFTLTGWIANHIDPDMRHPDLNIDTLRQRLPAPCLGVVPWMSVPDAVVAARYLTLPAVRTR